jgi:hypothetical protein
MNPTLSIAQDERRRHKRLPWRAKLMALSLIDADRRRLEALEAVDISFSGMGAVSDRLHDIGQRMVVALPREGGECSYVTVEVVRCQPRDGYCRLGLTFHHDASKGSWFGSAA